jgi:hypothetical protein
MLSSFNNYLYKKIFFFVLYLILSLSIHAQKSIPKRDLVPDKETAIKIAKAIWLPIYGNKIDKFSTFKADLTNDNIWIVKGVRKELSAGGEPVIYIRKKDCKIIDVYHTK